MPPRAKLRSARYFQRNLATAQSASTAPEPFLDFLYPSFGFFSRSLPPEHEPIPSTSILAPSWPPPRPPPPPLPVRPTSSRRYATVSFRTLMGRCACGRIVETCVRCRPASSAAAFAYAPPVESSTSRASRPEAAYPNPRDPPRRRAKRPRPATSGLVADMNKAMPSSLNALDGYNTGRGPAVISLDVLESQLRSLERHAAQLGHGDDEQRLDILRVLRKLTTMRLRPPNTDEDAWTNRRSRIQIDIAEAMKRLVAQVAENPVIARDKRVAQARLLTLAMTDRSALANPLDQPAVLDDLRIVFDEATEVQERMKDLASYLLILQDKTDGPNTALRLVLSANLTPLMDSALYPERHFKFAPSSAEILRRGYSRLLAGLPGGPVEYVRTSPPIPSRHPSVVALHLIAFLTLSGTSLEALAVWATLRSNALDLPPLEEDLETSSQLVASLTRQGYTAEARDPANHLKHLLSQRSHNLSPGVQTRAHRALAALSAHNSDEKQLSENLISLERLGGDGGAESVLWRMQVATNSGDLVLARSILDEYDTLEFDCESRTELWRQMVLAYVRADQLESALALLPEMHRRGLQPDLILISNILSRLAAQQRVEEAYALVSSLAQYKLKPNVVIFNSLIALHAALADPDGAERLVDNLRHRNLAPDRYTYSSLMNAYVKAGHWRGAVAIYEYLLKHDNPSMRPDAAIVNILLKASISAGVRATDTLSIFRRALDLGVQPNERSFTHVLHALSAAGLMKLAEDVFAVMDGTSERTFGQSTSIRPGFHAFTTLMYGYLRLGKRSKARQKLRDRKSVV